MNEDINKPQEISIVEIIQVLQKYWSYLLKKWFIIVIAGMLGGGIGLTVSLMTKPKYTAHLSFALVEKSSGGGGLADLASSFGFSGLVGGSQNAFSGDNLLEIMKSRHTIESTLLTEVIFNGKMQTLADVYIEINNFKEKWSKNLVHCDLAKLSFPINQRRTSFSRMQDSVLYSFCIQLSDPKILSIVRKDKKLSFVNVDFSSTNELFAKLFIEKLMDNTYSFYRQTRTSQSRANVDMMQSKADSIRRLYEQALTKGAGYSAININMAMQVAAVPRIKHENDAQLYAAVYAEVLKNLETLKLDLARETPIIQLIDEPRLPLIKEKLGRAKGIIVGGFVGGFLTVLYLLGGMCIKDMIK